MCTNLQGGPEKNTSQIAIGFVSNEIDPKLQLISVSFGSTII